MLPTFVIGLREGLEAALIVSIIATFLRRNGVGLRSMWVGVTAAVALSVAVGVGLKVLEQHLPQAEQEGLETVIGAVAVVFVTGMILWMRTHARFLRRDLETAAQAALGSGTSRALVVMAFLAVLREGFETSVFLLSTFSASTDPALSAGGAVLGIAVAVAVGAGIYSGGVRLDLARFFKVTGVFLVFVAAGLVLSALRTAHEAGWLDVGQGRTLDLGWLAPTGAVRTAVISGVLGIPSDPRVVELLGWACYLVPVLALTLWPASRQLGAHDARRLRLGLAAGFAVLAVALMGLVTTPSASVAPTAPLADGGSATVTTSGATASLVLDRAGTTTTIALDSPTRVASGAADTRWQAAPAAAADLPSTLSLTRLLTYTGQRLPVGVDAQRAPGPYDAAWRRTGDVTVLTRDGGLVAAAGDTRLVLTLSGGGLGSARVLTVDDPAGGWTVAPAHTAAVQAHVAAVRAEQGDRELWRWWFPAALLVAAAVLALRGRRRPPAPPASSASAPTSGQPAATVS